MPSATPALESWNTTTSAAKRVVASPSAEQPHPLRRPARRSAPVFSPPSVNRPRSRRHAGNDRVHRRPSSLPRRLRSSLAATGPLRDRLLDIRYDDSSEETPHDSTTASGSTWLRCLEHDFLISLECDCYLSPPPQPICSKTVSLSPPCCGRIASRSGGPPCRLNDLQSVRGARAGTTSQAPGPQ